MQRLLVLLTALILLAPIAVTGEEDDPSEWHYASETMTVDITRVQKPVGREQLTYYVAEIHIQDPSQLRSEFAKDSYAAGAGESTQVIAERNNAVIAINGDHCNHSSNKKIGIIARDGVFYRDQSAPRDLMYINSLGEMQVILRDERKEMGLNAEMLQGWNAVQTFEFGPALVRDGEALTLPGKYFIVTSEYTREPRTAIGQVGPLHYVVLVADGRRKRWSDKGMTFGEMQEVFLSYGCQTAYNLDGGGSSTLVLLDEVINRSAWGNPRLVSDIVYFID